ncbi:type VI secretion system contractile sheath large subunit [Citrobacter koseri]|uniref:type VI secretion system contractile sheath large subunit n=1 Tax=Citrobacter TaxID=544 RepID=UPI0006695790|nr:type VI secretion system contractile sheath large subunit [Citrobacter koseri]MBJ9305512.1 type VI secretion system contractile sheath large subunit [Citrobacter koseri]MBJ9369366.1 type VI secretion system contractile sheath large subunit [Citrobacter koseri]MDT7460854.1 type VI secretion system contractile sheath large subunit [Citrobacter koseri]RZA61384.1 type VI secretion system contractile sheath large subunit [Citrobacter koseri]SUX92998.1 T6SS protein Cts1B [Citrobacter koseri]
MSLQEEVAPVSAAPVTATSLLDNIMAQSRFQPESESYDIARQGVTAFIAALLQNEAESVDILAVNAMIADIDDRTGRQMDLILHEPVIQELEALLRSLKLLVERTDPRENIKIYLLHATKEELLDNFEFAPEITQSGFYKHVYSSGYGQFGGEPVAAVIGNYAFKNTAADLKLLKYVSAVSAMAHAPFLSSVAPEFLGLESWTELPGIKDIGAIFEGPAYTKWRSLRESEDSRYLGLTSPRFLLRQPYAPGDNPVKSFNYRENVSHSHDDYLWGNTAFLLAANMVESFRQYRWCPNIIGPQNGGAVKDLPVHLYEAMGQLQAKIPTEVLITDRREFELAEEGFITLTMRKGSDNAAFFSANSVQKPKVFPNTPEGKEAETNYKLGTQLPYLFIISRLAHYIKVLQREQIGSWKERGDLERELNTWIRQYVADQENPPAEVRSRKPLRQAKIEVLDVEGEPGWYQVSLSVRPHFKYMGASFELSLVGRLDRD